MEASTWIVGLAGYAVALWLVLSLFHINKRDDGEEVQPLPDNRSKAMGHYDSCRPGYCPACGAAPGNMKNGVCEFCGTKPNPPEERARPSDSGMRNLDTAYKLLRDDGRSRRAKGHRIDVYWDSKNWEVTVQVNGRVVRQDKGCPTKDDAREIGTDRQKTLQAAGINAVLYIHET